MKASDEEIGVAGQHIAGFPDSTDQAAPFEIAQQFAEGLHARLGDTEGRGELLGFFGLISGGTEAGEEPFPGDMRELRIRQVHQYSAQTGQVTRGATKPACLELAGELLGRPIGAAYGSAPAMPEPLRIADRTFRSRLLVGTGKFSSNEAMRDALEASGTELVTVALRRADLTGKQDPFANILDFIDPDRYLLLPNTSGAMNAEEAVRIARLAASAGLPKWVKLEIHPDPNFLLPDPIETLKAAEILVGDGFTVLPYINADPVLAKRLQEVGTATVMPLGSPIGTNRGIETRAQIAIIIQQATVPVIVDAGLGAPSHAAEALEMGADAVLVNTAIAVAPDPARMARAFRMAVEAGRDAFETGLPGRSDTASATSPIEAFLQETAAR